MEQQQKIRLLIRESLHELHESGELEMIEEGWLSRTAGVLGITIASLFNALGQKAGTEGLSDKYDAATLHKLEQAMEDPAVQGKLKEMGVEDNNIKKAIKRLEGKEISRISTKTAGNDAQLASLLRGGYHLTGVHTDTIIDTLKTITPQMPVNEMVLTLKGGNFFESGRFALTPQSIDTIQKILKEIDNSSSILLNITIESSTDRQELSANLQNTLTSLGYSADNQGLSQARNDAVRNILDNSGVNASLISQTILFEQGSSIIDDSARYVRVIFDAASIATDDIEMDIEITKQYPQTFEMMRALTKKKKEFKIPILTCRIPINGYSKTKTEPWECPKW